MRRFAIFVFLLSPALLLLRSGAAEAVNAPSPLDTDSSFRYVLRYFIDPEYEADARIADLVAHCKAGKVSEVMLFDNPEELFIAYPEAKRVDEWFALAKRVKTALNAEGIDMSVNPWITLGHASRGRRFNADQKDWVRMVGEQGQTAYVTPCPLDTRWQDQLNDYFARIARELDPVAIYVEDDFRLHNHEGMGFGGCFCRLHLDRFAKMVGEASVTHEQLFAKILAPGKPHPWRAAWLDLSRESILEPAKRLSATVAAANPRTRLAQMTSFPDVHSAEGRDWQKLRDALSPTHPYTFRPHLPPYTETPAVTTLPVVTRWTIACVPGDVRIFPELENSPRCGRFSKSGAYSAWECLESAIFGSNGITINHYDMMGNGIALDPDFFDMLAKAKPRLDALRALKISDRRSEGVDLLFSPDVARTMHSRNNEKMAGIIPNSMLWGAPMQTLGFSTRMVQTPSRDFPCAVSDETLRALPDDKIVGLLAGPVLLDVASAKVLIERGFGDLIGIQSIRDTKVKAPYLFEMIPYSNNQYVYKAPKMSADWLGGNVPVIMMDSGASAMTLICHADSTPITPGMVYFENELKGRIVTALAPSSQGSYYNPLRRQLYRNALRRIAPRSRMVSVINAPLHAYRTVTDSGTVIALLNPTSDPVRNPIFHAYGGYADTALMLDAAGKWKPAPMRVSNHGELISCETVIPPLDALILLMDK